eukprot:m.168012 g.168012  ORF g.168012 m.168012 type:complete len:111 (-) comp12909_c0_seq1:1626-1958(-)
MILVGSHRHDAVTVAFTLQFPRIKDFNFTGTGDLLAALFLAWLHRHPSKPHQAAQLAVATIQAVVQRTRDANAAHADDTSVRARELRLIQSKADIETPDVSRITVSHRVT